MACGNFVQTLCELLHMLKLRVLCRTRVWHIYERRNSYSIMPDKKFIATCKAESSTWCVETWRNSIVLIQRENRQSIAPSFCLCTKNSPLMIDWHLFRFKCPWKVWRILELWVKINHEIIGTNAEQGKVTPLDSMWLLFMGQVANTGGGQHWLAALGDAAHSSIQRLKTSPQSAVKT